MRWEKWKPLYQKIIEEFDYNKDNDMAVPEIVYYHIKNHANIYDIENMIKSNCVSICGPGKNLEEELHKLRGIIIAADEATSRLLKKNIIPDIIVTDFDGNMDDIVYASKNGSIIVLHAHGDNKNEILDNINKITGPILLTTQNKPHNKIYNFGGFTDGDRAYCIAHHFRASEIYLLGFDFDKPVPKKGKDTTTKINKLRWAKRIISMLREEI